MEATTVRKPAKRHLPTLMAKAKQHEVRFAEGGRRDVLVVKSAASGAEYTVRVHSDGAECSCDYGFYRPEEDRRSVCSHTLAAFLFLLDQDSVKYRMQAWDDAQAAAKQKKQKWYVGDGVWLTFSKTQAKTKENAK